MRRQCIYAALFLGERDLLLWLRWNWARGITRNLPGVLIVELDLPHDGGVVPVTEDDERQAVVDVSP